MADLNQDGYVDIIQSYRTSSSAPNGSVEIHLNPNGESNTVYYSDGYYQPSALFAQDLDGDLEPDITIYPNPAGDVLFIKSSAPPSQLLLFAPDGTMVTSNRNRDYLSIHDLPGGIDFLKVIINGQPITHKVMLR